MRNNERDTAAHIGMVEKGLELSLILHSLHGELRSFNSKYTLKMAIRIHPKIEQFDAFLNSKLIGEAQNVIRQLQDSMHNINGASTKGELDFDTAW